MKEIKLTRGYVALISDEDYERVNYYKWYLSIKNPKKKQLYAVHDFKYDKEMIKKYGVRHISLHRFIMNPPKNKQIDHIDGNGLNNQRANLRICTQTQNNWNFRLKSNNKSGYKGVCWSEKRKLWRVNIKINNKQTHVGHFKNKEEAARAYNIIAQENFGEFAQLNQI